VPTAQIQRVAGDQRRHLVAQYGDELTAAIGEEAGWLVCFYVSCDRRFSCHHLTQPAGAFRNRFPGTVLSLPRAMRRNFAELTAASEPDIAAVNPGLRAQHGPGLLVG
jgi:hypothetical protein